MGSTVLDKDLIRLMAMRAFELAKARVDVEVMDMAFLLWQATEGDEMSAGMQATVREFLPEVLFWLHSEGMVWVK